MNLKMITSTKNYEVSFLCFGCKKPLRYHLNFHPHNSLTDYERFVCYHCGYTNKITPSQYSCINLTNKNKNENKNENTQKMATRKKHEKTDGEYLATKDIGSSIGDSIECIIAGEGELNTSGNYGDKWCIPILYEKVEDGENVKYEKKLNLNNSNENTIIELFGEESKEWVSEKIRLVVGTFKKGDQKLNMIVVSDKKLK